MWPFKLGSVDLCRTLCLSVFWFVGVICVGSAPFAIETACLVPYSMPQPSSHLTFSVAAVAYKGLLREPLLFGGIEWTV